MKFEANVEGYISDELLLELINQNKDNITLYNSLDEIDEDDFKDFLFDYANSGYCDFEIKSVKIK